MYDVQDDDTFECVSKLTFTPSPEENNKEVYCQAINNVMDEALEDKMDLVVECKLNTIIQEENIFDIISRCSSSNYQRWK